MNGIRFLYPLEGDVFCGETSVTARVQSEKALRINGILAQPQGGECRVEIALHSGKNIITCECDGETASIRVLNLEKAQRGYRFTVDDCVRCFENLAKNNFSSIFEDPFLALWKKAHDEYGTMVHINAFEYTVNGSFNLSMMPTKYKSEFTDNASWLSLTFHARQEFPDEPYKNATYETVKQDCQRVTEEIIRFAGYDVLRDTTTLHWGAANPEGVRALRDCGFKALMAYLDFFENGEPIVSYHLDKETVAHVKERQGFMDFDIPMLFPKLNFVLNEASIPATRVRQVLEHEKNLPHRNQFIQTVIHEQYFYPDYAHYESDYAERVLTMAAWCQENGYTPVSMTEICKEL